MSNSSVGMMSWGGMEKRGEGILLRALSEPVEPVNHLDLTNSVPTKPVYPGGGCQAKNDWIS